MSARRKVKPRPHRFGHFPNARRVKVRGWYLPVNHDEDVRWFWRDDDDDDARGRRKRR